MAKDGDDERRSSPRVLLRRSVTITLRGTTYDTHTINVSTGGASVELRSPPEHGARGNISLTVTDGPPFDFAAEVRWSTALSTSSPGGADTRHLVGLQFVDAAPADLARLAQVLAAEDDDV
jgi:hypothetical protein